MGGKKSDNSASGDKPTNKKEKVTELSEKPPQPNREEFEAKKKLVDVKIEEFRAELKALTDKISGCTTGKEEFDQQKEECFQRLNETRQVIDELKAKKDEFQGKIRARTTQKREAAQAMRQLDRDMKEMNEDALEARIEQIEYRMNTDSMSLADEKKLMQEIKTLKAKRPEVQKKAKKLEELKAAGQPGAAAEGDAHKSVEDELTEVRKQLEEWMQKRDAQKEDIANLKKEREDQTGPIRALINERTEIKAKLTEQQNDMKALWDEFKAGQRVYNDWDKKRREQQKHKLEEERARADELWQAQKAKEELENTMEKPYFEELTNLEQTIAFCKSFLEKEDEDAEDADEKKKESAEKLDGFVQGATVLLTKKDRDQEMYFSGSKGKKGKKAQKANKAKPKGITHTAATFQTFAQLKVPAPMTVDDVPNTISKLNLQLDEYKEKIAEWEKESERRREELKAADEKIKRLEAEEAALKEARRAANKAAEQEAAAEA